MIPRHRICPISFPNINAVMTCIRVPVEAAYLVRTKANHSLQLDIRSDNSMRVEPNPHSELILFCIYNILQERLVLELVHRKPGPVDGKSAGLGLIHRVCDIPATLAVNAIGHDDNVGHHFLIAYEDPGTDLVVKDLRDARPERHLNANGDSVVVHDALHPTSVAIQVRETIELFWEILIKENLAVLVLAAEEGRRCGLCSNGVERFAPLADDS